MCTQLSDIRKRMDRYIAEVKQADVRWALQSHHQKLAR